ncbi:MAG: aminoacyl-tRNA hydrolase [Clostridia bacterium]|nr:aminoacyl-tRNA hydrolase [Clostridia bacterium]
MLFKSKPKYDFLIVGLGNPGDKYEKTRHNAGFRVVDILADGFSVTVWKSKYHSLIAEAEQDGKKLLLIKPQTFMNNSGTAVAEIVKFYKIPTDKILVVSDDVSMDAGRLRIRSSGSHGGHNGLKDIIELLGTDNIPRIKIGMGQKPHPEYDLANWVLGKPSADDNDKIAEAEKTAAKAILTIISKGLDATMNSFNR